MKRLMVNVRNVIGNVIGVPLWALLLALLWVGFSAADAHAQEVDWVQNVNSSSLAFQRAMAIDNDNNIYIAGYFDGSLTFGSTTIISANNSDIFLAKYDAQGNFLRVQQIGGTSSEGVSGLAVDSAGNIYLAGQFGGTITLGTETFTATGGFTNVFISKLDANGNFLWAKQIGNPLNYTYGDDITIDSDGNLYILGSFSGNLTFGSETLTSVGDSLDFDTFVAKYDTAGNVLWAEQVSGIGKQRGTGIAQAAGKVYIAGYLDSITTVGTTTLTPTGYPTTEWDLFLAAFDEDGNSLWARNDGGVRVDIADDIAADSSGNVYIIGQFLGSATFGPISVQSVRVRDGYLAKYDSTGAPLWVQTFGGREVDSSNKITVDNAGNVYITGYIPPGPGTIGTTQVSGNGFIVARYNTNGHFIWVSQVVATDFAHGTGLVVDSNGYVYASGFYAGTAIFWPLISTASDASEIFVARWTPGTPNEQVFMDGFESGDFSAWTNYSSDLGDLSVTPDAALVGSQGLNLLLDDNTPIGLRDEVPNAEYRYRARFYLDPNDLTMAQDENHVIFFGYSGSDLKRPVLRLELRFHDSNYEVRAGIFNDGTTWRVSLWQPISNEGHLIELDWHAATAPGTDNGTVALIIDEVVHSVVGLVDNDTRRIDTVRLGAIAGIDNGTRGTYYMDAFESRRLTYIGPDEAVSVAMAAPATVTGPSGFSAWTDIDESEPEEAALMQEVLEYAEQVEEEEAQEEIPPTEEEQSPELYLPWLND